MDIIWWFYDASPNHDAFSFRLQSLNVFFCPTQVDEAFELQVFFEGQLSQSRT